MLDGFLVSHITKISSHALAKDSCICIHEIITSNASRVDDSILATQLPPWSSWYTQPCLYRVSLRPSSTWSKCTNLPTRYPWCLRSKDHQFYGELNPPDWHRCSTTQEIHADHFSELLSLKKHPTLSHYYLIQMAMGNNHHHHPSDHEKVRDSIQNIWCPLSDFLWVGIFRTCPIKSSDPYIMNSS